MKSFEYILVFVGGLILLVVGIKGVLSPKRTREIGLKKNERTWYYTKTKIGKSALKFERERKHGIFDTWISSLGAVVMGIIILYLIISDILRSGWPK